LPFRTTWDKEITIIDFEVRQMTYLVTIAEIGSFRAAGERLFIAQPALTVSIRRLEEALGTRLFERHARGVSLTPAGEAFLVYARRSLGYAELAQENARRAGSGGWGTVTLGIPRAGSTPHYSKIDGGFHRASCWSQIRPK
jgi:DNA-binding transcriptional LysR family regulator